MFAVLDVVIAVMFVFALVSLLVSVFTEILASYMLWRVGHLWKALLGMVGQQSVSVSFTYPLIAALKTSAIGPNLSWIQGRKDLERSTQPILVRRPTTASLLAVYNYKSGTEWNRSATGSRYCRRWQ